MCIGHIINYRLRGALINSASGHLFQVKCEQYWTPGTKHFGNITVTTTSEIPLEDWTIRDFDIKNVRATSEFQNVCHCDSLICSFENSVSFRLKPPRLVQCDISISQPGQIDHGVPETTELLISFRHLVREHMDQYRHCPTVVHCRFG